MNFGIKKLGSFGVLIAAIIFSAGCVTIANGTQQYLGIMSDPPGATITVDGHIIYDTPLTVVLERRHSHTILIELEGYLPYEIKISRKIDWASAIVILPIYPTVIIDFITGGIYILSPERVSAQLIKIDIGQVDQRNLLHVSVVNGADTTMKIIATLAKRP